MWDRNPPRFLLRSQGVEENIEDDAHEACAVRSSLGK